MNLKRLSLLVVSFALLAFPSSASTVSFLVVETGLSEDISGGQYSSLWEGGLMNTFFDAGHIVTNNPIIRMEKKPAETLSGELKDDIDDAFLGGVDYLVIGFLNYKITDGMATPEEIAIKVYTTDPQALVYEKTFPAGNGKTLRDEYQYAQNIGKLLTLEIGE